ncbi:hypothetical protein NOCA2270149 [metagenome]|uniref:Uncharacterized protein n=1 Tax=metagenome TaxID=256318 RepID=A0A2P2C0K4_9ZZZZ
MAFFKIIAYVMEDELRARTFILSQNLDGLRPAFPLDEFIIKPSPIAVDAQRTGLSFGENLEAADGVGAPRLRAAVPEFTDRVD